MQNRSYAKRTSGAFQYAPAPLVIGGMDCFTNDPTRYLEQGYKRMVRTPMPTREGFYYTSVADDWAEDAASFTQAWVEHEAPAPAEDLEEVIDILTGEGQ